MSKIEALGPDAPEFKAVTEADWKAWRANPISRRLAGWLQESLASSTKERDEMRARAARSLDDPTGHDLAWARRDFNEINGGMFRLNQALTIIGGEDGTITASVPRNEAA